MALYNLPRLNASSGLLNRISLKEVEINLLMLRISAMEDFVGRGDRRLALVIHVRLGNWAQGMDS